MTRTDEEEVECSDKPSFAFTLDKPSFAFTLYTAGGRRERLGVTTACTTKESHTDKRHYTFIVAPSHRDFIHNMTTGALQADTAHIMVPADDNSTTVIAKDNHKAGEIQVSAKADPCNGIYTDEAPSDSQADSTRCRFAAVPSTCFTKEVDAGLPSAVFDCASEAAIQGWTKQHSRSISLSEAKQTRIDLTTRRSSAGLRSIWKTLKTEILTLRGCRCCRAGSGVASRARERSTFGSACARQFRAALQGGR